MNESNVESKFGKVLFCLLLTVGFCFLTLCLLSYSPDDPPHSARFVPSGSPETVHNICGSFGAVIASELINFCGVGAWFLLLPLFFRLLACWRRTPPNSPILKTLGVALMLAAVSGSAAFVLTNFSVGPAIGPGGRLGALVRFALDGWFAPLGSAIFLMSLFVGGVALACDLSLLRFFLTASGLFALSEIFVTPFKRKKEPAVDPEQPRRKKVEPAIDSKESEEEYEESEEDVEEEYEEPEEEFEEPEEEYEEEYEEKPAAKPRHATLDNTNAKPAYEFPSVELLPLSSSTDSTQIEKNIRATGVRLENAFADYGYSVRVTEMQVGPVLTLYEIELAKGVRLNQIRALTHDLEIKLKVSSVRIVSPIPGKNTVGVEIPNAVRQLVLLRDVMAQGAKKAANMQIPLFLGDNVSGDPITADLATLPHLLIAGTTGTGKSVCLNTIILSILMSRSPDEVRLIMIDPKTVELSLYSSIPHLLHPVVTDMNKAEAVFGWAVAKMEERYKLLGRAGVRQISEYNSRTSEQLRRRIRPENDEEWAKIPKKLPYIVIVVDEMSDLILTAGKDVETFIIRLAQKSRAVGIHLILATQKPTVDVITGQIKSNLPARIAFKVASQTDSRVVLDCNGAEQLLSRGDMLFLPPAASHVIRGQGTFVSTDDVDTITSEIAVDKTDYIDELDFDNSPAPDRLAELIRNKDKLYDETVEFVIGEKRASTSLLQRRYKIGYQRAARIIDTMTAEGLITGPTNNPSQPRDILMTLEKWREQNTVPVNVPRTLSTDNVPEQRTHFVAQRRVPIETEEPEEFDDEEPEEFETEEEFEEEISDDEETAFEEVEEVEETAFEEAEEANEEKPKESNERISPRPPKVDLRDMARRRRERKKNHRKKKKRR